MRLHRNRIIRWLFLGIAMASPAVAQTTASLSDQTSVTTLPRGESIIGRASRGQHQQGHSASLGNGEVRSVPRSQSIMTTAGQTKRPSVLAALPHQDADALNAAADLPDVPDAPVVPKTADGSVPFALSGKLGCGDSCGDSCGGACEGSGNCPPGCERFWMRNDVMLWRLNGAVTPALFATSTTGTQRADAAVLGVPSTTVLVGDEGIGDGLRLGTRKAIGGWIGASHAIEGYYMYLGEDDDNEYSFTSVLGDPIYGRPFYNARDQVEDAHLTGFPGLVDGTVNLVNRSDLNTAGLNLRQVVKEGCCGRLDLIGGYRYLRFRDAVTITENLVDRERGGLFIDNSTIYLQDHFGADNQWHGGEIGAALTFDRGRLSFDLLTKLGLGGIRRDSNIRGETTVTTPTGAVAMSDIGLLAATTNSGVRRDYDFSFIPEVNLGARFHVNDTLSVGAGYSLMYVTRVLRAGDMIDRNLNPDQSPIRGGTPGTINPAVPAPQLDDSTLRAHGLTLTAELHF